MQALTVRPHQMTAKQTVNRKMQQTGAGDGNRTRIASLEDRWRSPARRQRSGLVLLVAGVRSGGVTVTDRWLPSCVARMWHGWLAQTSSVSVPGTGGSLGCEPAISGSHSVPDRFPAGGVAVTSAVT
jgi:hypothetical protein